VAGLFLISFFTAKEKSSDEVAGFLFFFHTRGFFSFFTPKE